MKRKRLISLVLALILVCAQVAGCADVSAAVKIVDVTARDLQRPEPGGESGAAARAARGANDFAFRLSAELVGKVGDENFVCSPYSVWMPLAALVSATDEDNRDELLTALGASGMSADELNSAAARMLYDLTGARFQEFAAEAGEKYHSPLQIANAIFVDRDSTLKTGFAQAFADFYRGSTMNVDFESREAVDAVNNWASEKTDGLISDIVQEFDPRTVAALANSVYFSGKWSWKFNADKTAEDVFYSPNGETRAFYMLREGDNQAYYEDERVHAISMSFENIGGMMILLPKDGDANGLLSSMTADYFEEIQNDGIMATGKLLLPRFSIESGVMRLNDALISLGVPLFDEKAAPLTGGLLEEKIPVWLESAAQRAVIEVDEEGVTAAAVTVLAMAGAGMPVQTEPFEMNCNSPFVFVLYGYTFDGGAQALFTGAVNKP